MWYLIIYLSTKNNGCKYYGTKWKTENFVKQNASEEAKYYIRPWINGRK